MLTILRYEINQAINDVELPCDARILNVGLVKDEYGVEKISVWCEVDVDNDYAPLPLCTNVVRFVVFGTGANMDSIARFNKKYIGTVQKSNMYAFHVYVVNS